MLAQNASDIVVLTGPDGRITWVSPEVTNRLGWAPEDLTGTRLVELVHPEDAAATAEARARVYSGEEVTPPPGGFLMRYRTKAGGYRWMSGVATPVSDGAGVDVGVVSGLRDAEALVSAQRALTDSEERYRLLAENATDVVTLTDRDRRVLWVSPSVTRTLGWTPEELVGTRLSDLVHPDDRESTATVRDELYAGHEITPPDSGFVVRIQNKSGDYRWISLTATPVANESGTFAGVVGGWRYVDDLIHAQQAVQAERAALRATVDSLLDPHVVLDAVRDEAGQIVDFVYVDANPAACAYNGVEYQDLIGARLLDLLPGHAGAGLLEQYRQVVETGEPLALDDAVYSQELLGGVELHYDVRAAPVGDGLSYTWRDVTDRHRLTQRLAESEEQYRLLAENASDVIMRLSPGGSFEWLSGSVAGVLGWDTPSLIGHAIDEFVHPDDLQRFRQSVADASPERPTSVEFRFRSSDCTYRWVACRTRLKVDEEGTPVAVVGGLVDIADRKAAEGQELERLKEMEQFQRLTVGRELKMIELKKEIEYLRRLVPAKGGDPGAQPHS